MMLIPLSLDQLTDCSTILISGQIYLIKAISSTPVKCIIREPTPSTKVYTKRENQSMSNTAERIKGQITFFSRWTVTYVSENCFFWVCYCFKAI